MVRRGIFDIDLEQRLQAGADFAIVVAYSALGHGRCEFLFGDDFLDAFR